MTVAYDDVADHPVLSMIEACQQALDQVADRPLWSLDAAATEAALVELGRLSARVAELELRVAAHADHVRAGAASGASSAAVWWATATRQTRPAAHGRMRLALALEDRYDAVRQALAAGRLRVDQAQVVVSALDDLPGEVAADVRVRAEQALVEHALVHDARELRVLGRRVLAVVAPEVDDAHQARLLAADDRRAEEACRLSMADDGHGCVHGRFTIPTAVGAMLRKALLALASPRRTPGVAESRRPSPQRWGRAFREYVERYPADRLPVAGGVAATVVVTLGLDDLTSTALGAALLDTGDEIGAATARRLACEAGLVPVVLDGAGQPLDVGRRRRLFTEPQRLALAHLDRGCTAAGCDWPPGMCYAHHDRPWSAGGRTAVDNGRLLCPYHHARAHDPTFAMSRQSSAPGAEVAFTRRT